MILFSEQLIRIPLRESRIKLLLSVVEQDGSPPRVPHQANVVSCCTRQRRLGWFQDSSELTCFSRLSNPDKPVPTAPRLVTRGLELFKTIEEGCQASTPRSVEVKIHLVPSGISCEVFDLDMFISPLFKERTFSDECGIRRQRTHVIHKIPDAVQASHLFTVPKVHQMYAHYSICQR